MSKRKIISIDEAKCNGCGLCLPNCPEGALQVIDGKVRLISDLFCDGLGACIGYCPEGAISVVEREAEPYDERRVMASIVRQGANTIRAHLEHLESHGERGFLELALAYLKENGIPVPQGFPAKQAAACRAGCPEEPSSKPGAPSDLAAKGAVEAEPASALANWPVQLHLLSPMAPQFRGKDVLLSADCVAFAVGDFHRKFLAGRTLAIACPKLDDGKEVYVEKLAALIDHAQIRSLTVTIMQVPCCRGLLSLVQKAMANAHRTIPVRVVTVAIADGSVLAEEAIA
ncbi:MAG TPA: 4Fe-4S binding protein [Spirochaetia bacterium]|nr:4Fe-4S binding protein [Spirochaetia bacterium]